MSGFVYVCRACQRQLSMPIFEMCISCHAVLSLAALRRRGHLMAVQLEPPMPHSYKVEVSALRCPECDTPVQETTGEVCTNCGFDFMQWAAGSTFPAHAPGADPASIDSPFDIDPVLKALLRQCEKAVVTPCTKCGWPEWSVHIQSLARMPLEPPRWLRFLIKPAPPRPSSASLTCQNCERFIHVEAALPTSD